MMPKEVEDERNSPWIRVLEMLNSSLASVYCLDRRFVELEGCRFSGTEFSAQPSHQASQVLWSGDSTLPSSQELCGLSSAVSWAHPEPSFTFQSTLPQQDSVLTSWLCHANWDKVREAARNGSKPWANPCAVSDSGKEQMCWENCKKNPE